MKASGLRPKVGFLLSAAFEAGTHAGIARMKAKWDEYGFAGEFPLTEEQVDTLEELIYTALWNEVDAKFYVDDEPSAS
jgi:hypothetical protein